MTFYFSTRQIPGLGQLPLPERLAMLERAAGKMSVPEKTFLNILKLLVIVPAFALILRTTTDWTSLFWALAVFLLYPLVIKPIQYTLCAKYLPKQQQKESI